MKPIHHLSIALFLGLAAITGARGDMAINPALLYYQAFLLEPHQSDADRDYLFTNNWSGMTLPERVGSLTDEYSSMAGMLKRAAQQPLPCDWGIDSSRGPATLLPNLSHCKHGAQVLCLRATWALQHGNEAAAQEALLTAFTLGRHSAPEGFLIGVLVQFADEAIVYSAVAGNFSHFSPDTLQQLKAGFEAAPARTTVADAIDQERVIHTGWLRNKIQSLQREHPGNDAEVLEAIRSDAELQGFTYSGGDGGPDTNVWPRIVAAAGGTSDGVIGLVRELDPIYARLHSILLLPVTEFNAPAQQFDAEMKTATNPLFNILLPDAQAPRRKEFIIAVEAAMVRAAVAYKLKGEAGLQSVPDPCGKGPFAFQRFVFQGEDRGFQLTSTYVATKGPVKMIFVEKDGPAITVLGPRAGQAVTP